MSRQKWITLGIVVAVIVSFGLWVIPHRTATWVSVDGKHEWKESEAPPRRRVVWQPADSVTPVGAEAGVGNSLIRPQLADDGQTLYFTLRSADLQKDIYRSRLVEGVWLRAEPVAELNTEFDDIGPVISPDGDTLYIYSDREGGLGGFDIYVSTRNGDAWTTPQNLGDRVNSPAHEFDPGFDSQHQQLFFASNRSAKMHRLIREGKMTRSSNAWKTTLRADLGLNKFDLYVAQQQQDGDEPADDQTNTDQTNTDQTNTDQTNTDQVAGENEQQWLLAEPLSSISRAESNEGAPFVGHHGSYLYYVSDQSFRGSEEANFDIYRARIEGPGRLSSFENLGPGVNTPDNEIEPALSEEGFRIFFSRNAAKAESSHDEYSLFSSTAVEVQQSVAWDDSNLKAFLAALHNIFIDKLFLWILAALVAALIAAIWYYLKQVSAGRATVPVFLLCALLLHLFLGAGSFYVMFGGKLEDIPQRVREIFVATKVETEDVQQIQKTEQEEFEKINDLKSVETVDLEVAEREIANTPNIPIPTETMTPSIPARVSDATPIDRPDTPVVRPAPAPTQTVNLQRQTPLQRVLVDADVALEEPIEPAEATPTSSQTPTAVAVADPLAKSTTTPAPQPEMLKRKSTLPSVALAQDTIEPERTESTPVTPQANPQNPLQRTQKIAAIEPQQLAQLEIENTVEPAPNTPAASPTTTQQVDVAKSSLAPPTSTAAPLPLQRKAMSIPVASANIGSLPAPASETSDDAIPTFQQINSPLADRQLNRQVNPTTAETLIETEQVAKATEAGSSPAVVIAQTNVSNAPRQDVVNNTNIAVPQSNSGLPARLSTAVALNATPIERAETALANNVPIQTATGSPLSRNRQASLDADTDIEAIEVENVGLATTDPAGPAATSPARPAQDVVAQKNANQGSLGLNASAVPSAKSMSQSQMRVAIAELAAGASSAIAPTQEYSDSPVAKRINSPFAKPSESIGEIETITLTSVEASGAGDNADSQISGVEVQLAQASGVQFNIGLPTDLPLGGRHSPSRPDLAVGALGRIDVAAPVTGGAIVGQLARTRGLTPNLQIAEDNIGMQALLKLRSSDAAAKKDLIEAFGGNDDTLAAIKRGLNWLALHQHEDGHWSLNKFDQECKEKHEGGKCQGAGADCDTAGTGFALLPFLGDGQTHTQGEYQEQVRKGLKWLMDHQKGDGDLYTGGNANSHLYSHGVATIALCEAYALTDDQKVKHHAQRAIDFIVASQNKTSGGWRYKPGEDGDTSVLGWQVMALKSGQMGGLNVPEQTIELAKKWIDRVSGTGDKFGQFGYTSSNDTKLAMTGEALLVLQYMGTDRNDPRLIAGAEFLLKNKPQRNVETSYYWYYGTQFMYHMQGRYWKEWNTNMSSAVLQEQVAKDGQLGSWTPKDQWEGQGGRIYSTALRVLMLEVYYRHLPLYQLIDE